VVGVESADLFKPSLDAFSAPERVVARRKRPPGEHMIGSVLPR